MEEKVMYEEADYKRLPKKWKRLVRSRIWAFLQDAFRELEDNPDLELAEDSATVDEYLKDHVFTIKENSLYYCEYDVEWTGKY